MENNERTRTLQDARELTDQLSKLCTLVTETQQEVIECIEAFLTSRSIDADLRESVATLTDKLVGAMMASRNTDLLRQELLKDNELILSQRDQLQAQSVCYQDNLTECATLQAQHQADRVRIEEAETRNENYRIKLNERDTQVADLTAKLAQVEQERDRIRNDLSDALDCKAGHGPTVLTDLTQQLAAALAGRNAACAELLEAQQQVGKLQAELAECYARMQT